MPLRILTVVFPVILLGWLVLPAALGAQQEEAIQAETSAEYSFGQALRLSLAAEAASPIQRVTLFLNAPELPNTLTADVDFPIADEIDVNHVIDLTQLRLAPFTTVTYWWTVKDEDGNEVETDRQKIEYVDDQFAWREIERDGVQIFWTGDEPAVGQGALDAVVNALPEIRAIMPSEPPSPLRIYVYPTAADLRSGLRLTGRDWVGAHAHPELGVILVSAGSPVTAATDLARTIPHELAHLYLYQATGVGYKSTPVWLDEGLASLLESEPNPFYATKLQEAAVAGETIALSDLCYTFPTDDEAVLLAYAQSADMIRYIQSRYGNQALRQMIVDLADGADCETVTERSLGISMATLNQNWLDQVAPQSLLERVWRNGRVGLAIIVAGFLLLVLLVALPRGRDS
ncbi:MAG: hypothetical protein JSW55_19635 [Chloroflexota bacterium]|nr:MAG: hypothetical protein JSW55_19635 [Chloroflexota bacterium]